MGGLRKECLTLLNFLTCFFGSGQVFFLNLRFNFLPLKLSFVRQNNPWDVQVAGVFLLSSVSLPSVT